MPGLAVIEWIGDIDVATVTAVERPRVDELLDSGRADALCLDLSRVTFFDSSGLGLLAHTRNSCRTAGVSLTLRGVTPQVRQLLAITGMVRLFDIEYTHPTAEVDLTALPKQAPLPPEPVVGFDRIARLVARLLDVPTATVTFVGQDGQVSPGAVGMREPAQSQRIAELSHSLCKHVVARAADLIVPDLSADPLFAETPAAQELRMASYVGTPITRADGRVVGSLCAISDQPSDWSQSQLADLRDLADVASAELQAREAAQKSHDTAARLDALRAVVTQLALDTKALADRAVTAADQSSATSSSAAV